MIPVICLFVAFGAGIVIGRILGLKQGWANASKAYDTAFLKAIGYTPCGPTRS
jgi:hypothetical protein